MKQTKTMVKRNGAHIGLCAVLCVLLLTVAGIFFGTRMGTATNAKANISDSEARAEIESFNGSKFLESATLLSHVTLKNNINNETTNAGVYFANTSFSIPSVFVFVPKTNPFTTLREYRVKSAPIMRLSTENTDKVCMYSTALPHFFPYSILTGRWSEGMSVPDVVITYELELAPTVPLPDDPVKEGYHFVGWYYDEELTLPYDNAPLYEDTQLYAKFEINKYTVTYDTDGGTYVADATVDWNTAAPMPEPTRTGYNFVGWFKEDGMQYNGEVITENTKLTARWDIKIYTVTFYVDGVVYTTTEVPHGVALSKAMTQAKVANYRALDMDGVRVSLQSVITEDTQVLIHELSGWEKYGNFVGRSPWYTWLMVGLGGALAIAFSITVVLLVKARRG